MLFKRRNVRSRKYRPHLPHILNFLLAGRLALAHEEMSRLRLASLDLHELVKLQHPPLAARPSLAALVEDGRSGMVHALLLVPRDRRIVGRLAPAPAAGRIGRDLEGWVVLLGLGGRGF